MIYPSLLLIVQRLTSAMPRAGSPGARRGGWVSIVVERDVLMDECRPVSTLAVYEDAPVSSGMAHDIAADSQAA